MRDIVHDKAEWIFKQEQSKPQIPFALSYILISDPFPLQHPGTVSVKELGHLLHRHNGIFSLFVPNKQISIDTKAIRNCNGSQI